MHIITAVKGNDHILSFYMKKKALSAFYTSVFKNLNVKKKSLCFKQHFHQASITKYFNWKEYHQMPVPSRKHYSKDKKISKMRCLASQRLTDMWGRGKVWATRQEPNLGKV